MTNEIEAERHQRKLDRIIAKLEAGLITEEDAAKLREDEGERHRKISESLEQTE